MSISAHVMDWANGIAAGGVHVRLERYAHAGWTHVSSQTTGSRGNITDWPEEAGPSEAVGVYRITIDIAMYFAGVGAVPSYRDIMISFSVQDPSVDTNVTVAAAPSGFIAYLETLRT